MKDAIAESVRRQLTTFTAFVAADGSVPESLHPIYLDLIVDGFAVRSRVVSAVFASRSGMLTLLLQLRDQFEWDISRAFADIQAFASTVRASAAYFG